MIPLIFREGDPLIKAKANRKKVIEIQYYELYKVACYLFEKPFKTA